MPKFWRWQLIQHNCTLWSFQYLQLGAGWALHWQVKRFTMQVSCRDDCRYQLHANTSATGLGRETVKSYPMWLVTQPIDLFYSIWYNIMPLYEWSHDKHGLAVLFPWTTISWERKTFQIHTYTATVRDIQITVDQSDDLFICIPCNKRCFPSDTSLFQHCHSNKFHKAEWCERRLASSCTLPEDSEKSYEGPSAQTQNKWDDYPWRHLKANTTRNVWAGSVFLKL